MFHLWRYEKGIENGVLTGRNIMSEIVYDETGHSLGIFYAVAVTVAVEINTEL